MKRSPDWSLDELGEIVWEDFAKEDHHMISAQGFEVLNPSTACVDKLKSQLNFGKYNYAVDNLIPVENDHNSVAKDLNFHDWPDIDNCDVGRMFRYCDSTFRQSHVHCVDELSWLPSPSDVLDGSEASYPSVLLSSPELGLLNEKLEDSCANINDFPEYSTPTTDVASSSIGGYSGSLACRNDAELESISVSKTQVGCENSLEDDTMQRWVYQKTPASAVSIQTCRLQCLSDEKQNKNLSESGMMQRWADEKVPAPAVATRTSSEDDAMQRWIDQNSTSAAATQTYPFQCLLEENHFFGCSSGSSYMHNGGAHAQVDYSIPTEWFPQAQLTSSSNKFDNEIHPTTSNEQFAPHSHQVMDHLKRSVPPVMLAHTTMEKLSEQQSYAPLLMEHSHHNAQTKKSSVLNKHIESRKAIASGELDGVPITGISSKITQQNALVTCVSSDGISVEAKSFQQLWHVMHQLDARAKLLIRDSLYRLARSIRQRNIFSGRNCCSESMNGREILGAEALNNCRYSNVETDTNAIDRSIAHLLFQ